MYIRFLAINMDTGSVLATQNSIYESVYIYIDICMHVSLIYIYIIYMWVCVCDVVLRHDIDMSTATSMNCNISGAYCIYPRNRW